MQRSTLSPYRGTKTRLKPRKQDSKRSRRLGRLDRNRLRKASGWLPNIFGRFYCRKCKLPVDPNGYWYGAIWKHGLPRAWCSHCLTWTETPKYRLPPRSRHYREWFKYMREERLKWLKDPRNGR